MSRFAKLATLLFVTGSCLFASSAIRAQETQKDDVIRPITKSGSAAFLFTLNGLGDFKIGAPSINGMTGGLGAKWFVVDDIAIRLLLGISTSQTPGILQHDSTETLTTSNFGVGVGGEYHFRPLYSTSPYVGLQIGFVSNSQDREIADKDIEAGKTTSFGVNIFAGFDWFFTRGIAAGAEMGLGFVSNGGTAPNGTALTSTSSMNVATNGNVHLVVYF